MYIHQINVMGVGRSNIWDIWWDWVNFRFEHILISNCLPMISADNKLTTLSLIYFLYRRGRLSFHWRQNTPKHLRLKSKNLEPSRRHVNCLPETGFGTGIVALLRSSLYLSSWHFMHWFTRLFCHWIIILYVSGTNRFKEAMYQHLWIYSCQYLIFIKINDQRLRFNAKSHQLEHIKNNSIV